MRFSRTQLVLSSVQFYLFGLAAICIELILEPMPARLLAWSSATVLLLGAMSFAMSYFTQFRHRKDRTLEYPGGHFVFFVLCRPIIPFAFTAWALYAMGKGSWEGLESAMSGWAIFFASHLAEFLRMRRNGSEAGAQG